MAGRDSRADIIDESPFSNIKQKIPRVHSTTSNDGTIHINLGKVNSFFNNKKPKPEQTKRTGQATLGLNGDHARYYHRKYHVHNFRDNLREIATARML